MKHNKYINNIELKKLKKKTFIIHLIKIVFPYFV